MKIDGPTIALILSILGLMATLFFTKLGNDVRKNRIKINDYPIKTKSAWQLKNVGKQTW